LNEHLAINSNSRWQPVANTHTSPSEPQGTMNSVPPKLLVILIVLSTLVALLPTAVRAKPSILKRPSPSLSAGTKSSNPKQKKDDAYHLLARSIQNRLNTPADSESNNPTQYDTASISSALRSLYTTQAALKKIDGTAHEMYQRTHKSSTSLDDETDGEEGEEGVNSEKVGGLKVAGRMSRNAARVGCIADALFAAELCELIKSAPPQAPVITREDTFGGHSEEGTLASWTGRKVVLNTTIQLDPSNHDHGLAISVLVVFEPDYNGGAGVGHGGVDDLLSFAKEEIEEDYGDEDDQTPNTRGRYLIILSDHWTIQHGSSSPPNSDLRSIISILDRPPERVRLNSRKGDKDDSASVPPSLYHMAGKLLEVIGPVVLNQHDNSPNEACNRDSSDNDEDEGNEGAGTSQDGSSKCEKPAIHFVGYSLAGGVAAMAANILDGALPLPKERNGNKQKQHSSLSGVGHARTSALCIGPPPCISRNLQSTFITSVIHGDDIVCRTTHATINHLCDRIRRSIKGGLLGRSVGWMSEAVSLTVSGLKSNEDGKKGGKLILPGNAFLVRPRRIGGGSSSIHEVGGHGRETFRATLLFQLNDILLSKSLWVHHQLDAYVRSLDRVRLKGFADDTSSNNNDF